MTPASDRQVSYIRDLFAGREIPNREDCWAWLETKISGGELTSRQASDLIDRLKRYPRRSAPEREPQQAKDGMYELDGCIYKVQCAVHGSGKPYAKRLVDTGDGYEGFEYAPGVARRLRPEHRMTVERAKQLSALYGTCIRCGSTLTNETSIEQSMGPVCVTKI